MANESKKIITANESKKIITTNESKKEKMIQLQEMIEAANKEGLLMCMTDAEVTDIKKK